MFETLQRQAASDRDTAIWERLRGASAMNVARYGSPDPAAVLQRYGTQLALAGTGTTPLKMGG